MQSVAILPTQKARDRKLFITILNDCAQSSYRAPPLRKHLKSGIKVWNQEISEAPKASKKAIKDWTTAGKPKDSSNITSIIRRLCRQTLRKHIRCANAEGRYSFYSKVMVL